ncbi:MAG: GGDEF domain-containing protein [Deltaproteobacteria bacterium]|jgi:diguanylate cyclase|nr:GGDEF domain-containing protein [Deltaproteobacteria bacterium]
MPQFLIEEITEKSRDKPLEEKANLEELVEATYEMAKKILPFLASRKIPLTPENYRIFYDYFLSLKPDLSKRVDELLEANCRFSPEVSEALFRDYYFQIEESAALTVEQARERIASASESLNANLGATLNNTSHFRQILAETVNQINLTQVEDTGLKTVVDNLLEETVTALSSQTNLVSSIEKARQLIASLTDELKDQTRLANVDELTQLYNRRYFGKRLSHFIKTGPEDQILSVLLFDIDRFKVINDTWGHNIGDKVLILCARIIKNNAGDNFMAVRFGGEEFMILCPALDRKKALALAESVRSQIENTQVTIRGTTVPVTISCGVTQYIHGDTQEDFVGRADEALYQAKSNGRNQVVEL